MPLFYAKMFKNHHFSHPVATRRNRCAKEVQGTLRGKITCRKLDNRIKKSRRVKCVKAGSINYHRTWSSNVYEIRFVIFSLLFGSRCKSIQSCSSLRSFTLLHFDLKNKLKI